MLKYCIKFKGKYSSSTPASFWALHSNNHEQIIQIKHKMINNPNWQEADQLAIY